MKTTVLKHKAVSVYDSRGEPEVVLPKLDFDVESSDEELEEYGREALEQARQWTVQEVAELSGEGWQVAFSEPAWLSNWDWVHELICPMITARSEERLCRSSKPLQAKSINLYLQAPEDVIQVRIESTAMQSIARDGAEDWFEYLDKVELFTSGKRGRFYGQLVLDRDEMTVPIVTMKPRIRRDSIPDGLAEQVLATLDLGDDWVKHWPLPLYAAMADVGRCHVCRRPLNDLVSRTLFIGPTCAAKMGIPHNRELADKVLAYRVAAQTQQPTVEVSNG